MQGFFHCIQCALTIAGEFHVEWKTAMQDTLMQEKIYGTGHIKTEVIKQAAGLFFMLFTVFCSFQKRKIMSSTWQMEI